MYAEGWDIRSIEAGLARVVIGDFYYVSFQVRHNSFRAIGVSSDSECPDPEARLQELMETSTRTGLVVGQRWMELPLGQVTESPKL
jgi:hypothetical protein